MKLPAMTEVKSSNLHSIGVRGSDLFVRFIGGGVYKYPGAGHLAADGLKSESVGSWFRSEIRGHYAHEKLSE
jgi:hypothetical protein